MEAPRAYAVRRAIASDAPALAALARVTEEQSAVRSRVHHLLTLDDRAVHVAESANGLIGLSEVQFYGVSLRRPFGSARLHDLFVVPAWRRRGVARVLFAAAQEWAGGIPECHHLEWQSAETGLPFYASLGLTGDRVADLGQYPFFEITLRPKH